MKMVLMMSKAMHHVNYYFRISPAFLAYALNVVEQKSYVK